VLLRSPIRAEMVRYPGPKPDFGNAGINLRLLDIFQKFEPLLENSLPLLVSQAGYGPGDTYSTDEHLCMFIFHVVSHLKRKQSILTAYSRLK